MGRRIPKDPTPETCRISKSAVTGKRTRRSWPRALCWVLVRIPCFTTVARLSSSTRRRMTIRRTPAEIPATGLPAASCNKETLNQEWVPREATATWLGSSLCFRTLIRRRKTADCLLLVGIVGKHRVEIREPQHLLSTRAQVDGLQFGAVFSRRV